MPFPQGNTAQLVEFANFTAQTGATYQAKNGDFILHTPTGASVVTLPVIAATSNIGGAAGPVTLRVLAAFAVTVKTSDGSTINGVAGTTGLSYTGNVTTSVGATFVSDGTNWWTANS